MLDSILLAILTAALNGLFLALAFYIGYTKGTRKAVKIVIEEIEKTIREKQELQALITALLTQKKIDPPEPKKMILLQDEKST
ncbi:MAG: hypothetical protein QXR62_04640 [Candidatus Bathyarchaeia archaeon]